MFNLGVKYQNGEGVAEDDAEAARWFRKAAAIGNSSAMFNLGLMYDNGEGMAEDDTEAVRWYRSAAEAGDTHAMVNLGAMYAQGDGVGVTYRLTNVSDEPVTLPFSSGQRYDLVLHNESGVVWGWSWTRLFTAEAGELVLAPRDTFQFEERIPLAEIPDAPDGVYVVRAYMTALNAAGEIDTDATEAT